MSERSRNTNTQLSALTVGVAPGDLKTTSKLYEVRISVTGADVTDILSVGSVGIRIS